MWPPNEQRMKDANQEKQKKRKRKSKTKRGVSATRGKRLGRASKGFVTVVGEVGSKAFEQALDVLNGSKAFLANITTFAEGPKVLRVLCFLGGLAMTGVSLLGMADILSFVSRPSAYTLQVYEALFGLACMAIEAKDARGFDKCKPWITYWFKFLTVSAGKGMFYVLMGMMGVTLWQDNLFIAVAGGYMIIMGLICWMVHFGMASELQKAGIDITQTNAGYPTYYDLTGSYPFLDGYPPPPLLIDTTNCKERLNQDNSNGDTGGCAGFGHLYRGNEFQNPSRMRFQDLQDVTHTHIADVDNGSSSEGADSDEESCVEDYLYRKFRGDVDVGINAPFMHV